MWWELITLETSEQFELERIELVSLQGEASGPPFPLLYEEGDSERARTRPVAAVAVEHKSGVLLASAQCQVPCPPRGGGGAGAGCRG